jgi:ligand-binding SRPBCC domain-containing protein
MADALFKFLFVTDAKTIICLACIMYMMNEHVLVKRVLVKHPIEKVFEFFSDAGNLKTITPPHLHFDILTPVPIPMHKGALIDYKLKLYGFSFSWQTEIIEWNPPYSFADKQLKGPYALWLHEHIFEPTEEGTIMVDKVHYRSPGGFLEFIPHHLLVKHNVKNIFEYRERALKSIFPE